MADLNSNTLTNIDRICYCAGIRTCSLGSVFDDAGTLFHKGGNRALVYRMRYAGVPSSPVCRNWYDTCNWALGLGTGWFFPTVNESIILYSCTDIRSFFCGNFWIEDYSGSGSYIICMGCAICYRSCNKNFNLNYGVAVKTHYY